MSTELSFRAAVDAARARGDLTDLATTQLILADYLDDTDRHAEAELVRQAAEAVTMEQGNDFPEVAGMGGSVATRERVLYRTSRWPRAEEIPGLDRHQREKLTDALVRPLGILTGSPGVGKTFCLAALVVYLSERFGENNIAVCAPTGKAAVRCRQSVESYLAEQKRQVMTPTPRTIHSLLSIGRNGHDGRGWGFEYNRRNPLPFRYVICDEASMLSTALAANLLAACADHSHVLLVGDTGQLPPVGHGSPLRDMIASGVPHGELTEIRRNAGLIVRACAAMRRGQPYQPADKFDAAVGLNWRHVEVASPDDVVPTVKALLAGWKRTGRWNPLSDVQVVCALNDKGPMARQELNRELQELLNPAEQAAWAAMNGESGAGAGAGDGNGGDRTPPRFRTGDKVMCLRNGWYATEDNPNDTQYVANGEQGTVLDGQHAQTLVTFGDRAIMIRPSDWSDFDLGFAVTAHRMQGSSSPVVIVVVDRFAGRVCCREWWYTALSRASELVITVGRLGLLRQQAGRPALANRKTALKELIEEGMREVI